MTVHWTTLPHAPAPGTVVARRDALADGQATLWTLGGEDDPTAVFGLILLRDGAQVRAYVNRCPHFGVALATRQSLLLQKPGVSLSCNVHYARFRWADGLCESGDCAGESLIPLPLVEDADGRMCVGAHDHG